MQADPGRVALSHLRFECDGLAAEAADADLGRPHPLVEATVTTGTLALDPYPPEPAEATEAAPEEPGADGEGLPTDPWRSPCRCP